MGQGIASCLLSNFGEESGGAGRRIVAAAACSPLRQLRGDGVWCGLVRGRRRLKKLEWTDNMPRGEVGREWG